MAVDAPIQKIIGKLKENGFIRKNKLGTIYPKGITALMRLDHYTILQYFNQRIRGILNYYHFAGNRSSL